MSLLRIALTGGPCAGKTTALREVREQFGNQVLVMPEVASILLEHGFPRPGKDVQLCARWIDSFQSSVLPVQVNMENEYANMAAERISRILLCDRGILDGAAYLGKGLPFFLDRFGLSAEEVYARYDAVVHLESLAVSNPELYEQLQGSNPARYESPEEAAAMDWAIQEVWNGHPNHHLILAGVGMKATVTKLVSFLGTYLSQEIEVKYRLAGMPPITLPEGIPISQGYLPTKGGGELRIRRIGDTCYLTVKGDGSHSRDECERQIDSWAFDQLWPSTEGRRVIKTRYLIPYQTATGLRTVELDQYSGHLKGLVTLECEFLTEQDFLTFALPIWAVGASNVTEDQRYKNKILAIMGIPD